MAKITHVGTVGVPVTDHDRSLAFYVDKLGCEVRIDGEFGPGMRWAEVAPPGADTTIALMPLPPDGKAEVDTAIRLASSDAAADHADLKARGVDVDAEVMNWEGVPPMFSFRDPDGNTLYVVER